MRILRKPDNKCREVRWLKTDVGIIKFILKRSSKRRTISISINQRAEVIVSAPTFAREDVILNFINEKSRWIVKRLNEAEERNVFVENKKFNHGERFLFLGHKYEMEIVLKLGKRSILKFNGKKWTVNVPCQLSEEEKQGEIQRKLIGWYRLQAKEILGGRIFHYSRLLGVEPLKIAVRTQKRIWGNCDYSSKTIHINWQVIMSPLAVLDYIVVHELCHLIVPNHSKRFWKKVEEIFPDYNKRKRWLKDHLQEMMLPSFKKRL